jgi:hypothetical protein
MLKDPNHLDVTAYELLGLPFDVALPDVLDALKRFMRDRGRKTPHLLGAAAQAQKKLQSPVGRAELDIWLYDIELKDDATAPARVLDLDELSRPRALAPSELYCDLTGGDLEADKRGIKPQRMKFSDVRAFDNIENIRFMPRFDR